MNKTLKKAKALINEFCLTEYGSFGDFSDLTNIPIAYTTDTNEDEIQVSCDLKHNKMMVFLNNCCVVTRKYKNLKEMIDRELSILDFSLVYEAGVY